MYALGRRIDRGPWLLFGGYEQSAYRLMTDIWNCDSTWSMTLKKIKKRKEKAKNKEQDMLNLLKSIWSRY